MSIDLVNELERTFYTDGYRLGMEAGPENTLVQQSLMEAISRLYQSIDEVIESLCGFSRINNRPPHCRKGCGYCCHQPVFASMHEISYLSGYINQIFTPSRKIQIISLARQKNEKLSVLGKDDLLNSKFPCPLLDNEGACTAYAARPVSCRIYLSFSSESCIAFYNQPENENSIPDLMAFPLRMGRIMNEGFMAALKIRGFENREVRIEEGLLATMQEI